jgi:uncharacterized protein (TIGR03083 family)
VSDFTQLTRTHWLELGAEFYAGLAKTFASLSPAEWERGTPYLGWSASDVLAHMTSAMPVNFREMLDRALAGHPEPPAEFDTFTRNAHAVAARRGRPVAQLIDEFSTELSALLATYRGISDTEWLLPAWFFVGRVNIRALFLVQFADNVFHERDLLHGVGRWPGLNAKYGAPLVDWFVREYRVASFRPERAVGLQATVAYRLGGVAGGEWTMRISDGQCSVERGPSADADLTIEADVEDLVAAALARASPVVGHAARLVDQVRGPSHTEDVVATITGVSSLATALAAGRIRIHGSRVIGRRVQGAFWHFWQRRTQTIRNITR